MTRDIDYNTGAWVLNDLNKHTKASYLFTTAISAIAESADVIFANSKEDAIVQVQNLYPIDSKKIGRAHV